MPVWSVNTVPPLAQKLKAIVFSQITMSDPTNIKNEFEELINPKYAIDLYLKFIVGLFYNKISKFTSVD